MFRTDYEGTTLRDHLGLAQPAVSGLGRAKDGVLRHAGELPDADVVDEHRRRIGAACRIPAAGTGDGQIQHWEDPVVGQVERPPVKENAGTSKYGCAPST